MGGIDERQRSARRCDNARSLMSRDWSRPTRSGGDAASARGFGTTLRHGISKNRLEAGLGVSPHVACHCRRPFPNRRFSIRIQNETLKRQSSIASAHTGAEFDGTVGTSEGGDTLGDPRRWVISAASRQDAVASQPDYFWVTLRARRKEYLGAEDANISRK